MRFLDIARGSLAEVEYYLHFVAQQNLLNEMDLNDLILLREETGRLLTGLWRATKAKTRSDWDHTGSRAISDGFEVYDASEIY